MTYVFVIVIKNIKSVVVGMDNPEGLHGGPPFTVYIPAHKKGKR